MPPEADRHAERPDGHPPAIDRDDLRRIRLLQVILALPLILLVAGLAYRQLDRSADYQARESRQSLRRLIVPAPRGVIYDREHRVLAASRRRAAVVLNLGALRSEVAAREPVARGEVSSSRVPSRLQLDELPLDSPARLRLAIAQRHLDRVDAIIGRHTRVDDAKLERAYNRERAVPFVLTDDLTDEEADKIKAALESGDPVRVVPIYQRWYPRAEAAAQVVGRTHREPAKWPVPDSLREISESALVGDSGLEKYHDAQLRGRPGEEILRIDAFGFPAGLPVEQRRPVPGADLVLSLDLELQDAAARAMTGTRGGAVALDIATGEILAMVSKPDFDLNEVSPVITPTAKRRIDAEGGWLNRATQALYPPGSTFKIFTVLAGLRTGTLRPGDVFHCDGAYRIGDRRFVCHNPEGHGDVSLATALAHSCNVYAYHVGLAAGPEALAAEARRFHFDQPTGVDLPHETRRMLVPDPAWKRQAGGGAWTVGDTINLSIGQGALRISPLQAACAVASLARRETLTVPTLLYQPGRKPTGDRPAEPLGLRDEDYTALVRAMQAVIETGIGRDAQVPGVTMAGKTGTAQVSRAEGMANVAWFVAFAPVERPRIAVAVALEGDEPGVEYAGAKHAAPVVRELIGTYFDKRPKQ